VRYHLTWIVTVIVVTTVALQLRPIDLPFYVPAEAEQADQYDVKKAETTPAAEPPPKKADPGLVSRIVAKQIQEARELINKGDLEGALPLALEAASRRNNTPREQYFSHVLLSTIYIKRKDYAEGAQALEAALASGESPEDTPKYLKIIAQLHYATKNYPRAIETALRYEREFGQNVDVQIIAAQSYYLQRQFNEAALILRTVAETSEKTSNFIKEDWLKLWMSAEYERRNFVGVERALKSLVKHYPGGRYEKDLVKLREKR